MPTEKLRSSILQKAPAFWEKWNCLGSEKDATEWRPLHRVHTSPAIGTSGTVGHPRQQYFGFRLRLWAHFESASATWISKSVRMALPKNQKMLQEWQNRFPLENYFGFDINPYTSFVRINAASRCSNFPDWLWEYRFVFATDLSPKNRHKARRNVTSFNSISLHWEYRTA